MKDDIPFGVALPSDVLVDPDIRGKIFCCIDDLISVGLFFPESWHRLAHAAALVIDLFGRPLSSKEPIKRDPLLSLKKLSAGGALEESKTILGWLFDFRRLKISLTEDKCKDWVAQIKNIRAIKSSSIADMDSLIGRLNHACQILKMGHHFLNRLRVSIDRSKNSKSVFTISSRQDDDLAFWETLLAKALRGVSFNVIVFRRPTHVYLTDSCPYGLSGFSLCSGRAWRIKLPRDLIGKASNDLLEFIAGVISIWIDIIEGRVGTFDCCLALGDNTSAISWLHLSNFCSEKDVVHETTARLIASLCIDYDVSLYSQHFKGVLNTVADSLSRDHHIPVWFLTDFFTCVCPSQMPSNFHMSPVPREIVCWLYRTLRLSSKPARDPKEQKGSAIRVGLVGQNMEQRRLSQVHPKAGSRNFQGHLIQDAQERSLSHFTFTLFFDR